MGRSPRKGAEFRRATEISFSLSSFGSISFNGNTFAEIARRVTDVLLAEFPLARRREAASLAAHYVAGVLDWDSLRAGLNSLCEQPGFQPGDRVRTLKGSTHGVVVRLLKDGRVAWRPDGSQAELLALPESLLLEEKKK